MITTVRCPVCYLGLKDQHTMWQVNELFLTILQKQQAIDMISPACAFRSNV